MDRLDHQSSGPESVMDESGSSQRALEITMSMPLGYSCENCEVVDSTNLASVTSTFIDRICGSGTEASLAAFWIAASVSARDPPASSTRLPMRAYVNDTAMVRPMP
jgi:hypothetical protein